ncbi:MAG: GIY-YIG nuclease family protein [Anaerolineae bacterium]|nr:GIY-YIG nuclease family protein [Anaerolineae bacterium]
MGKGTYVLVLALDEAKTLRVGALGVFDFAPGIYAYVGSAFGPGGLDARLKRHRRSDADKRLHWHIDYLRQHTRLLETRQTPGATRLECVWARALAEAPGATIPAPGFGASDCTCAAHLFHFTTYDALHAALGSIVGMAGLFVNRQPTT